MRQVLPAVVIGVLLSAMACDSTEPASSPEPAGSAEPAAETSGAAYSPEIDRGNFVATIDNPLFPLEPGTVFKLKGETEDGIEKETITVTDRTKEVMGVTTTVVKDTVRVDGEIAEDTFDWYAQDETGNVWYFGEDTAEYENGKVVSREGSWEAGVDGALPGIIISAGPQVTDSFRQEHYEGEAEDMFWVVATRDSLSTPFGDFDDVVQVLEWTPLEPNIVVKKVYAPGVGLVFERALSGPKEIVELTEVIRP
jgi:hypothetical protein